MSIVRGYAGHQPAGQNEFGLTSTHNRKQLIVGRVAPFRAAREIG